MPIVNEIARAWWAWMAPMAWQVTVLAAAVWLVDGIARRRLWPQLLHALWLLVLLKLLLPPSFASPMSIAGIFLTGDAREVEISLVPPVVTKESARFVSPATSGAPPAAPVPALAPAATEPVIATHAGGPITWRALLLLGWLVGIAAFGSAILLRLRALGRLRRTGGVPAPPALVAALASAAKRLGIRRVPELVVLPRIESAAIFGLIRPVVFLPADRVADLTPADAEHVFLHELAHMRRGDLAAHAATLVLQAIYWFHPAVWLAALRVRQVREICCDATVSAILRDATPGYRRTLLDAARRLASFDGEPAIGFLGLTEDVRTLAERLRRLERATARSPRLRSATIAVVAILAFACALPMGRAEAGSASPGEFLAALRTVAADVVPGFTNELFAPGRRVQGWDLSEPTGRIAYRWATGDDRLGITIVDLATGNVVREITEPPTPQIPRFSPDGRAIVFAADGERGDLAIWTCAVDGGVPERVFDEPGLAVNGPTWRPDGRAIAFWAASLDASTNATDLLDQDFTLRELDLASGRIAAISSPDLKPIHRIVAEAHWAPTGNRVAYQSLRQQGRDYRVIVAVADRMPDGTWRARPVPMEPDEMSTVSRTAWSPDGEQLAVVTWRGMEPFGDRTIAVLRASDLSTVWSHTGEQLTDIGFSLDGRHLWACTDREFLWFSWPGGEIVARLPDRGLKWYYHRDYLPNLRVSADGKSLWYLDGTFTGEGAMVRRWTIGGACDPIPMPPSDLDNPDPVPHRVEDATFTARDGLVIPIRRYIPPEPRAMAVVVCGPVIRKWHIARLLKENYEVVHVRWRNQVPDFRWVNRVQELGRVDGLDVVDGGLDWKRRYGANRPVAVMGERGGGFLALRALRDPNNPFACAVLLNAATSVEGYEAGWTGQLDPAERDAMVRDRSPLDHAAEIRRPVLAIHAALGTAPVVELEAIAERMRAAGTPCTIVPYEETASFIGHRDEAFARIFAFLDESQ